MTEVQITIINKLGLHARAAAKLVATAGNFGCTIRMTANQRTADAKSIMSVMMLAAGCGTELQLQFDGDDKQEAMDAVVALINNRFGEPE